MNTIRGKAFVIKKKSDYYLIKDNVILVAKNTHPELVTVISNIQAIVTEVDNKLCHAAIIAREFDKPILMGVENIVAKLKNGDKIIVDFNKKVVKKTT